MTMFLHCISSIFGSSLKIKPSVNEKIFSRKHDLKHFDLARNSPWVSISVWQANVFLWRGQQKYFPWGWIHIKKKLGSECHNGRKFREWCDHEKCKYGNFI